MPSGSFGYVPTPAIVAPIEFTLTRDDYLALGGHGDHVQDLETVLARDGQRRVAHRQDNPWPGARLRQDG